jgi:Zn-dependent protease/CBS domain-containing protein
MGPHRIVLGRIAGIAIDLDYSWFVVFVLVAWSLARSYFPAEFPGWPRSEYWLIGAAAALLFFASVLLHELGHSAAARAFGVPVRRITLFIFGGMAQIGTEPPRAGADFLIALAGPLVSGALAAVCWGLQRAVAAAPALALFRYLAYINLILGLFNLIPGFPLDGGRVLRAAVWAWTGSLRRATLAAAAVGRGIAFVFILFGVWQMLGGRVTSGLWIAVLGWFLESAAAGQIQQQEVESVLAGHRVRDAMTPGYVAAPADASLEALVDEHIIPRGARVFVVTRGADPVGLITLHDLRKTPRERWGRTRAGEAMTPLGELQRVEPDTELWTAIEEMDRRGVNQLPVISNTHIVGMLSRENVIAYLRALRRGGETAAPR